ncbi:MAG TPA: bifunctional aspartate kinase/homoserine dehydrogenase I [Rectinemataceae bacterium]|nr:bifunctional aspartate kinase/homoserine dehydrogenase I [Rectinemataceae bacterium]
MKVLKFGGTSVGSPDAIRRVVDIALENPGAIVVVSALGGVTDAIIGTAREAVAAVDGDATAWTERFEGIAKRHQDTLAAVASGPRLLEAAKEADRLLSDLRELLRGVALLRELSPRSLDLLVSFGERLSARIVTAALLEAGLRAAYVDAREIIVASGPYGNARPIKGPTERAIVERVDGLHTPGETMPVIPVVTGYIARTEKGDTITFGRGGSDYSAALIAAAIDAEELEIWTDVDGILTADPRKVADAFSIPALNYEEAMELSHFGAKVIYPPTIQPALEKDIPIRIRNSFNPNFPGTVITFDAPPSKYPVRAVTSISPITLARLQGPGMIGVRGVAGRLFACLADKGINIVLISQASSERSICFAISPSDNDRALAAIDEEFAVELADGRVGVPILEDDKAIIAVVGERMRHKPGISARIFGALGGSGVNVAAIAQGSSELNVSAVIEEKDEAKALRAMHDAFFLAGKKSVNVFLVGHGVVGTTLLDQLREHKTILLRDFSVRVNLVGISDRKRMLLDSSGIDIEAWKHELETKGEPADLSSFVARAKTMGLPNSAFVDCTASTEVPLLYPELLKAAVAIVTPNKKGNSGSLAAWRELMDTVRQTGTTYLYETTVGAGLPVISTMKDLLVSGDRIIKVEAMLSGTLGYILANFDPEKGLARLVRKARELGYTEPDPREDLGAVDFARKALIIARECGFAFEYKDVVIEPIVSAACMAAPNLQAFYAALEDERLFERRFEAARARGANLVFTATISAEGIRLALQEVPPEHPLHGLNDAENVVTFTTARYSTMPLVVRGPGAGAAVTAGGVFADIVRIARSAF